MSLSAEKLKLHAIAVAEAVHNRAVWLAKVKAIRNHQRTETAEGYAVTLNAYRSAKRQRWMRATTPDAWTKPPPPVCGNSVGISDRRPRPYPLDPDPANGEGVPAHAHEVSPDKRDKNHVHILTGVRA